MIFVMLIVTQILKKSCHKTVNSKPASSQKIFIEFNPKVKEDARKAAEQKKEVIPIYYVDANDGEKYGSARAKAEENIPLRYELGSPSKFDDMTQRNMSSSSVSPSISTS